MLVNSPNWALCFLYKQFGRIWLFNFHNLFHLIIFLFLITSYTVLCELCKEKLDVDKVPGAERVKLGENTKKLFFAFSIVKCKPNFVLWIVGWVPSVYYAKNLEILIRAPKYGPPQFFCRGVAQSGNWYKVMMVICWHFLDFHVILWFYPCKLIKGTFNLW